MRYMTFSVLQLGWGRVIGTFCITVVLSAKHLVINKGHIAHARQQCFIGFLKFCRLLLNMVCGYLTGGVSVV